MQQCLYTADWEKKNGKHAGYEAEEGITKSQMSASKCQYINLWVK